VHNVTVVIMNDNFASTAIGPIEVFHSAGLLWQSLNGETAEPRFKVTVASVDGKPVTTPYSIAINPQCSIHDIARTDLIVVSASGPRLDAQFERHRDIFPWLRSWHKRNAYVAGICSGVAFLAEAGLLNGHRATTHWAMASVFQARYPEVIWRPDLFITEDRHLFCSGGVYSSIDLSLYLVEKFCGHDIALQCAKALLVAMPRTYQSGYALLPLSRPHGDERIRDIEDFIAQHHTDNLSIERLAERAHMSPRTLLRRFKAATGRLPGNYLQAQRVATSKALLEIGTQSVQAISYAVGYEDIAFFRRVFKRETGMAPAEYRNVFSGIAKSLPDLHADSAHVG